MQQKKLTKYASCQLCSRFLGEPDDKLQKVKSNTAYSSDCNAQLCMNCYKPFYCQVDIVLDGANHACMVYVPRLKEKRKMRAVLQTRMQRCIEGDGSSLKKMRKKQRKEKQTKDFEGIHQGIFKRKLVF